VEARGRTRLAVLSDASRRTVAVVVVRVLRAWCALPVVLARLAAAAINAILTDERLDVQEQVKGHLELAVCTFL